MNNKLAGAIFILFGIGLLGESVGDLYQNARSMDYKSIKSILGVVLGISSCIYGYKRTKSKKSTQLKK